MNALIVCFSQSGNTLKISEQIAEGIRKAGSICSLESLENIDRGLLLTYDLVGLGSPVFYYKEPFNVADFIESLPQLNGQKWFVFCTHGNVLGNFFPSVSEKIRKKGADIVGFYHSYAEITVPYYPKPSFTSGHPDITDLSDAQLFGRKLPDLIHKYNAAEKEIITGPPPKSSKEWIKEANRLTRNALEELLPRLSLDTAGCIKCYKCEKNCPVGGIDIENEPPRIQNPCIYCWRCVNVCPTLSITADWDYIVNLAPPNFVRYRRELEKAAVLGDFRWLIDPQKIRFDDPLYKQRRRELKKKG